MHQILLAIWATMLMVNQASAAPPLYVFITNVLDNTVTVIDGNTLNPLHTLTVGPQLHHMAVTPDQRYLLVGNASTNDLTVLSLTDGQPVKRIKGVLDPYNLMFSPDRRYLVSVCTRRDIIHPK